MDSSTARARVERELETAETLLWFGTPDIGQAASSNIGQSLIGVALTAFALFWMSGAFWATRQGP